MLAELSTIITMSCSNFAYLNQQACYKATEAYIVQSKADEFLGQIKAVTESEANKRIDRTVLIVAGVGAKYVTSKTLQYKIKVTGGLNVGVIKTPTELSYTTGYSVGF